MPTAPSTTTARRDTLPAGVIDLAGPGRPPHPGGRPCGALCVPACTAGPHDEPSTPSRPVAPGEHGF